MMQYSLPMTRPRTVSVWWLIAGILLAVTVFAGSGCSAGAVPAWQAPKVALVGFAPREFEQQKQVVDVVLRLTNPNDRTLPVKAMSYRLALEGEQVAEGTAVLDRLIPPQGSETVEVAVAGNLLGFAARLPGLALQGRPLTWTLNGNLSIINSLLKVPYHHSGEIAPRELLNALMRSATRQGGAVQ